MKEPRVYADFNNADSQGRLRLNCVGTIEELARQQIVLQEGERLILSGDGLEVEGTTLYSPDEGLWVAVIDWDAIRQTAESGTAGEKSAA